MSTILLLYATTDGHTLKICERLKEVIESDSTQLTLAPLEAYRQLDLASFDKIVVGASIRYGKHSPLVFDFVKSTLALLDSKPSAFFSVNIVARKAGKNRPENNPYLLKFLRQVAWRPKRLAVFAGRLDYPKCRVVDRLMIRLIMWITQGPTDPHTVVEFTDWRQVEEFGRVLREM